MISIQVVPGASRSEITGMHGRRLRLRVAAPADGGRANRAALDLLAKAFDCRVDLLSGARSRIKQVLLREADPRVVEARIASL